MNRFKIWKAQGHKIFCFDEESLTYYNDDQYYSSNCDKGIENYIDKVFASGHRHYKTLSKRFSKNQFIDRIQEKEVKWIFSGKDIRMRLENFLAPGVLENLEGFDMDDHK